MDGRPVEGSTIYFSIFFFYLSPAPCAEYFLQNKIFIPKFALTILLNRIDKHKCYAK